MFSGRWVILRRYDQRREINSPTRKNNAAHKLAVLTNRGRVWPEKNSQCPNRTNSVRITTRAMKRPKSAKTVKPTSAPTFIFGKPFCNPCQIIIGNRIATKPVMSGPIFSFIATAPPNIGLWYQSARTGATITNLAVRLNHIAAGCLLRLNEFSEVSPFGVSSPSNRGRSC